MATASILFARDNAIDVDREVDRSYNGMTMKYSSLNRAEDFLRKVVEEPFARIPGDGLDPYKLAKYLAQKIIEIRADGTNPSRFNIRVNPIYFESIHLTASDVEDQVSNYVSILTERAGYPLSEAITLTISPDPNVNPDKALIEAIQAKNQESGDTQVLLGITNQEPLWPLRQLDAFLIVQGRRHVPLDQPVIRIGRRIDNDLVIDYPSVSRQHAQIQWRQPYFVIYDVSSHGQTTVNGNLIKEHVLTPGDVIGISDILLVYGEGLEQRVDNERSSPDEDVASTLLRPQE